MKFTTAIISTLLVLRNLAHGRPEKMQNGYLIPTSDDFPISEKNDAASYIDRYDDPADGYTTSGDRTDRLVSFDLDNAPNTDEKDSPNAPSEPSSNDAETDPSDGQTFNVASNNPPPAHVQPQDWANAQKTLAALKSGKLTFAVFKMTENPPSIKVSGTGKKDPAKPLWVWEEFLIEMTGLDYGYAIAATKNGLEPKAFFWHVTDETQKITHEQLGVLVDFSDTLLPKTQIAAFYTQYMYREWLRNMGEVPKEGYTEGGEPYQR